ncbi:Aste57867_21674 [Aphanomyces stellatus]|uniref:Aste57867_21674 protein n=1 Tax=Aphanomyces stellatus TaxID=120398 RepID=A0A485LMZ1_9STRA|nr:hypothetical protein As57867_021605 [Aphanomyces stellatus]VFT98343.1 Aste57867_21674 [Aphanomyces stellatus]
MPMACVPMSGGSILAISLAFLALVLSSIALGLPTWTVSSSLNPDAITAGLLGNMKFSAGVWGYCLNADYDLANVAPGGGVLTLDQCFNFYSAHDMSHAIKLNGVSIASNVSDVALGFSLTQHAICDTADLGGDIAIMTPLSQASYIAFATKSCSALGKSSLAFSVLATGLGFVTFVTLLAFAVCCSTKVYVVTLTFVSLSFASSLVAFVCWLVQTHDLNSAGVSLGLSFAFEVASCGLYLCTLVAIVSYQQQGGHNATDKTMEEASV